MVILPPARTPRLLNFLKSCILKLQFAHTNKDVTAQVIHSPTATTVASSASSQEKALRSSMETTGDVAAAAMFGKKLAACLHLKDTQSIADAAKIGKIVAERLQLKTTRDGKLVSSGLF